MKKVLLCAILVTACLAEDPCSTQMLFTDLEKRAPTFKLVSGETPLSDRYMEEGWYGDLGVEMSTKTPDQNHCGTVYPVYLKEEVPDAGKEEIVDVCIYTDKPCGFTFKMKIKHCEFFNVYYLTKLPMSSAAYCIGSPANKGEYPEYKTTVEITVDVKTDSSQLVYYCKFPPSTKNKLWYTVLWYVDGRLITFSKPVKESIMDGTRLEEKTLHDQGIKVGFNVKCVVKASFHQKSPLSLPSISKEKFIGIKILTPIITMGYHDEAEIKIQSTVPIGCDSVDPDCKLNVEIIYPATHDKPCDQHVTFEHSDCRVEIDATDWNKITKMKIKMSQNDKNYFKGVLVHFIKLRTETMFVPNEIWSNYNVGDVQIQLEVDTSSIQSKSCHAICDPHMLTFEGSGYDHQYPGIFTLYENTEWKQEIQFKTSPCYPNKPNLAYCICGLAVRVGKDVFAMNHSNRKIWSIGYTLCEEPKPLFEVRNAGGSKFEITLPSGTTMNINIVREDIYVQEFIDVYITPSRADENTTLGGLCGNINKHNNPNYDYSRDGSLEGDRVVFSKSWSVSGNTLNLFNKTDLHKLTGSKYNTSYCNCNPLAKKTNNVTCDNTLCTTITQYRPSRGCTVRNSRKKRSVSKYLLDDHQFPQNEHRRVERSADDTWRNGWTEIKAREYCTSLFKNSSAVQLCKDIPTVDLDGPMNNCVLDIKFMGDTSFALVAVETVKNKCYQEVSANTTLREESEPGKPSLFNQVKVVACPLECSHRGDCKKGICKCEENYGGIDCSVDIKDPPIMEHLSEDGYCDLADDECSEVSVFGGVFVETENSSCKINSLEGDFCMSGGVCYENGEPHGSHECYICSATNNSRSWVFSKDPKCHTEQKGVEHSDEAAQPLWIIGVVLGCAALISIGAVALWYITVKSKRKIASSPDDSKTVVSGPPPYSSTKD